ncbi:MAG: MaoC family dehydratase [Actinomycetota bacterium]|nr:MaoC family dehydratase [Actinomycetota bacterium]
MSGLWFEQLEVGLRVEHATTRTVTETDNVLFTTMTMNPQPLHLDAEYAARSQYGQVLVNSMFTVALVVGLAVPELTLGTTVANLGFSRIDFPAPVFIGDTIHVFTHVIEARRSRSRPGTGIVTFEHHGINQRDETVCLAVRAAMMRCRPEPARPEPGHPEPGRPAGSGSGQEWS